MRRTARQRTRLGSERTLAVVLAWAVVVACGEGEKKEPTAGSPFCTVNCSPIGEVPLPDASTPIATQLTLTIEVPRIKVAQKASADVAIVVARPAGMVEAVSLDVTNLPLGASATTFIIPHDQSRASFRITLGANTPQGAHEFDVTIRSKGEIATAKMTVDVIGAPGVLDPSFGSTGSGRAIAPATDIYAVNMARQPDGGIVLAGTSGVAPTRDFAAVRFTAAGVLDAAFGTAGKAAFDFGIDDGMSDMVVQPDGKIVSCGSRDSAGTTSSILFGRWLPDGKPDTTFGNSTTLDGRFIATPSTYTICYGLALQTDGKVLAAGSFYSATPDHNFAVYRLTAAGALDATFGAPNGYTQFDTGTHEYGFGIAPDAQGRIVVTGEKFNGTTYDVINARFSGEGALDVTFGGGPTGYFVGPTGAGDVSAFGWRTLVQADGKIVVAGAAPGSGRDFLLARYDTAGALDASFGTGGKTLVNAAAFDRLLRMKLDAQGRILFAGFTSDTATGPTRGVVGRVNGNGSIDTSFGNNGVVVFDFNGASPDIASGIDIQPDGLILIGGHTLVGTANEPWVTRLWP